VTIDAQIQRNVHAKQTNVAAGDGSDSIQFQRRVTAFQGCAEVTRGGEQEFCLVCVELQSVGGHPMSNVKDAALELTGQLERWG